ncbi:hypothetical protein [Nitrosovibrio sp. Nv4]|uniref:hypothetical protein n=1 Tax=Nitrosovibrio sp. Nv4 TaxID=1945880 RepID=UPI000BE28162|nr:hypothetical protein [Nitrosovibrio sp. Nv4]
MRSTINLCQSQASKPLTAIRLYSYQSCSEGVAQWGLSAVWCARRVFATMAELTSRIAETGCMGRGVAFPLPMRLGLGRCGQAPALLSVVRYQKIYNAVFFYSHGKRESLCDTP